MFAKTKAISVNSLQEIDVKSIVLLVDWRLGHDEFWLRTELENLGYNVTIVGIPNYDLRNRQIRWRKLILWGQYLALGWRGARMARRSDGVVVAWCFIPGIFARLATYVLGAWRLPVVALNMIAFDKGFLHNIIRALFYRLAFVSDKLFITTNSSELRSMYTQTFKIPEKRIAVLSDSWNPKYSVLSPNCKDSGYIFAGGEASRDWKTLLAIAKERPEISFKIVARRMNWDTATVVPSNVELVFDIPSNEFYDMVTLSRIVLLPLNTSITSGLIVLIRSALIGRLVISTKTPQTARYFPPKCHDLLIPMFSVEKMASALDFYWGNHRKRIDKAKELQSWILENFSPQNYARKVGKIIEKARKANLQSK